MFHDIRAKNGVAFVVSDLLSAPHAFTTRPGGVSEGVYASLNLGEHRGDDPARVRENYLRLGEALRLPENLVFTKQVHGSAVREVTSRDRHTLFEPVPWEADGLVTREPDLALFVFIADCTPILLEDPEAGVVAAAHAGWRGTVADIAGETVRRMTALGGRPERIRAAIGPCIGFCCFETGAEVPAAARRLLGAEAEPFIRPSGREGHFLVDLKGLNRTLLMRAGLAEAHIDTAPDCTRCLHEKYWSHRWTGGIRGSQAALIFRRQ